MSKNRREYIYAKETTFGAIGQTWVHSRMPIQNNFPSIGFELLPNIRRANITRECLAVIQNLWRENYFEWAFMNGPKSELCESFRKDSFCFLNCCRVRFLPVVFTAFISCGAAHIRTLALYIAHKGRR